ncbi:acyl-CoA dehydrogenase family member 10 isoform X2 [Tachysurus fulvidraco]|nr:acyl-CoA dehydrogenase family member 10 isoform X2 [Tachysurus fulvidraco]XP_047674180.1 acyl-CoA dehydrogenase family member 10 isoform X2 [Tachysurus fulvidraco]XP_047674181.1 acyl-CoA dehydrogenase family member 10 isoform X2 [Tachysurus fulvidraco]XP_047674182.1 acyl-CoA dehydrogenase family member 10 isoform X2 [Tachysurus fulvidraco]
MTGVSWFLRVKPPFHRRVCSSSSPRAIIFDMFGVLIPSPIPKATEWENENFVPAGTIGQAIKTGGNNNSWSKYMRGELGPEEFVEAFSRDCSQIAGFKVHIGPLHSALTGGSMSQPVTVMIDAVQRARVEGFKTAVLSNNFLLPGGKSYLPLNTSFFDVIIESCRVGLCKPDLRIYQLCAERLGVSPHEAVFLDDLSFNVEAAGQLGMHGITVRDHELAVKELEKVLKIPLSVYSSGTLSVSQNQQLTQYLKKATQLPLTENIIMRHLSQSYLTDSTYLLTCGQHQFVLKKKRSSEALQKECRLNVLREAKFPVPSVIYQDEMSSNVLGTPFYLTFYCPGRVFIDHSIPGEDSCGKRCVYETMIKTLCQINRVDLETTSLENRRDPENPDVRAVLGWSLSTVGDPLVDVATCCMSHFLPATASTQPGRFFAMMGILSAEEIFDLYRKEMGLEYIPNWQFYMAFCSFRQAAILQTNYKTSLKVTRNTNKVEDIVHLAWDFATKEGFRVFNALP